MRNHRSKPSSFRHLNGLEALSQGSNLIHLYKNGVAGPQLNPFFQTLCVCHKQIVPHQLDPGTQGFGQKLPSLPVLLLKAVFNRNNGELFHQTGVILYHLFGRSLHLLSSHLALPRKNIHAFILVIQLAGGRVYGDIDLFPWNIPAFFNSLYQKA